MVRSAGADEANSRGRALFFMDKLLGGGNKGPSDTLWSYEQNYGFV